MPFRLVSMEGACQPIRIMKRLLASCLILFFSSQSLFAQEAEEEALSIDQKLDSLLKPIAVWADKIVFYSIPVAEGFSVPIVLILLAATAAFLTWSIPQAFRCFLFKPFGANPLNNYSYAG